MWNDALLNLSTPKGMRSREQKSSRSLATKLAKDVNGVKEVKNRMAIQLAESRTKS
jgi:osmotically-inducible protein OsmY